MKLRVMSGSIDEMGEKTKHLNQIRALIKIVAYASRECEVVCLKSTQLLNQVHKELNTRLAEQQETDEIN